MLYKKKWPLIVFLTPALAFMIVFLFYPFIVNIYNSFFEIPALGVDPGKFAGMKNYAMLFTDLKMREAFRNTLIIMACAVVFQVGASLLLALLVDLIPKGADFYRTVYFFPIVISATAIGLMFYLFYVTGGALDQIVQFFGAEPPYWLGPKSALAMVIIPIVWQYVGFYFIILLTGLNNISEELYEAAKIDGATRFQCVGHISLPLLKPVLATCVTLSVTGALKVFDMPWTILPNGAQGTFFTGTYMYFVTFMKSDVDYASTIAILIVVLGVAAAAVCGFIFKERGETA
jgi:raffinose/stachyose/melibiose transport system permease protein